VTGAAFSRDTRIGLEADVSIFLQHHFADAITIGLLVLLEGLLSADNALVLAVVVLGLPKAEQRKALRYGIVGAFTFRILAVTLAVHVIQFAWVKLLGGGYLMWLAYSHFFRQDDQTDRREIRKATPWLGLSAFWATVLKVEVTDFIFAMDSILAAVAMSPKTWVVISGGILGIVAMRVVVGQLLALVQRYPAVVDGAFVIIAWVASKLFIEYAHQAGWIAWEIPRWASLSLIVLIFSAAVLYAKKEGPRDVSRDASDVLEGY
jgi:YkoY family integral membrane protein